MIGIYLSGTGNTKHCIEKLTSLLDETAQAVPIEKKNITNLIYYRNMILSFLVILFNFPMLP